jgi:hypothetical protein
MQQYIYGASVQGIQPFIFQTNKLKEIVGASQLVGNICTTKFTEFCKTNADHTVLDDNIIMAAAGNIRYLVDAPTCLTIVKKFPKYISIYASGINIVQAVVEIEKGDLKAAKRELEKRLTIQKNLVAMPIDTGFMGLERARRTGGVAFDFDKDNKQQDLATSQKAGAAIEDPKGLFRKFKQGKVNVAQIPLDVEHITKNRENAWLAIIHADGNGLGEVVRELLADVSSYKEVKKSLADFSKNLETATEAAAQEAFEKVATMQEGDTHYPLRPVILGGDDLTVIIRADLAFDFTKAYLLAFEKKTEEIIGKKLTACAGISYIKQSYPFHYGVHLAEELTKEAKTFSKKIGKDFPKEIDGVKVIPSSLSFYKVQASYLDELKDMKERTHQAKISETRFDYGPYLLHEMNDKAHVGELEYGLNKLEDFKDDKSKGISKLRNWLAELHKNKSKADFMMNRMEFVNSDFYKDLKLARERNRENKKTLIKDLLELYTF